MMRLVSGLLALSLVLTGQAMAVARGAPDAVGVMVICAGGVSAAVAVDAEGNPVGPAHLCPDCALAMMGEDETAPITAPLHLAMPVAPAATAEPVEPTHLAPVPPARGPPVLA